MLAPQQIESVFLRPSNIASRRFTRTTGGYDLEEVHQFLEDVADYLSRLEGELEWRRALRTRHAGTIGQQKEAISVVTEARKQAERIMADARKEAEGYIRLARAIAHQLALEAQARRPHVALAVTRASGSSTTVAGQDFDDMEVWIDASVFDVTKLEEPPATDETPTSGEASVTADAGSGSADASEETVAALDDTETPGGSTSDETSQPVGLAVVEEALTSEKKAGKKARKRSKKKS